MTQKFFVSYLMSESATSSPAWCWDERDGYQESALPTIKITSSSGQDTIILPSVSRSTCIHTKIQERKYRDRLRRLLHILASRILVLQFYTLTSPHYWSRDRLSLYLRRSLEQEQTLLFRLTSSDLTASMQANITYDLLWQHQVVLLQQIDDLRDQITQTSYNLDRAERFLARNGGHRVAKKRNKWIRTLSLRRLEAMDIELRARMQNLALCQAQISAAHNAAQQNMLPNNVGAYYNTPYISRYVSQRPSYEETQAFADAYPPTNHIEVFDLSHMPATPAEPIPPTMRLPHHQSPSRPFRDSGFWEPPMYAQPFDLDPTTDHPTHTFSHELATPSPEVPRPDSAASFASARTSQSTSSGLNPAAEPFTLKLRARKPLRITPTTPPPVQRNLDTARSPRYLSPHLTQSPNSVFLRNLMDRTLPPPRAPAGPTLTSSPTSVFFRKLLFPGSLGQGSTAAVASPSFVSIPAPAPGSASEAGTGAGAGTGQAISTPKHNRRYSDTAIQIIESRLENRRSTPLHTRSGREKGGVRGELQDAGRWMREQGGIARRRGFSIADVAVKMWYFSPTGLERVEEMVWPVTA